MSKSAFQELLANTRRLTILTGAGVSAESGIPTFRGAGGLWRTYQATELASPQTWNANPGLLWEFYNYRRQIMLDKKPNPAHHAIAKIEKRFREENRQFHLITQNIDDLHLEAGSQNVTRMHGSLWLLRCCLCSQIVENRNVPITPSFEGSGSPDPKAKQSNFQKEDLPKCSCGGILRPHVVWFGESLAIEDMEKSHEVSRECDLFLVVGTSAVVYPAAGLSVIAQRSGAKVAVVNLEPTTTDQVSDFNFQGKAGEILPDLLMVE